MIAEPALNRNRADGDGITEFSKNFVDDSVWGLDQPNPWRLSERFKSLWTKVSSRPHTSAQGPSRVLPRHLAPLIILANTYTNEVMNSAQARCSYQFKHSRGLEEAQEYV
ncbi:hypothetical protein NP233_g12119 [Leucocoprinus birnbaumii]|uniref:Uncharacterized protein n=1 Tax=Leucocoprinus birnbaumii TaxID=56174 RepID=A0AAD5VG94_9AGAR|nr:hypothetical protein NP233_g12119 [Leucocoprinus birnbaumii]